MAEKTDKELLFERMHTIAGMPCINENLEPDPQKRWTTQKKVDAAYVSLGELQKDINNVMYLTDEEKTHLNSLIDWVVEIIGAQIPKYYEDDNNDRVMVGGIQKI